MLLYCPGWGKNPHPMMFLGEKPPYEDRTHTHGMCPACEKEMEKEI